MSYLLRENRFLRFIKSRCRIQWEMLIIRANLSVIVISCKSEMYTGDEISLFTKYEPNACTKRI